MPANDSTISIRLPGETRKALDEAAKITRRSRAFLIKEALDKHLNGVLRQYTAAERRQAFQRLYTMQGTGKGPKGYRTAEDIDAMIRKIRGDD